jgi:hypothetical protein
VNFQELYLGAFKPRRLAGVDQSGTGFCITFYRLPEGSEVYVTKWDLDALETGGSPNAIFVNGAVEPPVKEEGAVLIRLSPVGTACSAAWEFITPNESRAVLLSNFRFGFKVLFPLGAKQDAPYMVDAAFWPISTVTTASSTAPIPRYMGAAVSMDVEKATVRGLQVFPPYVQA